MLVDNLIEFLGFDFLTKIWIEGNLKWVLALFITFLLMLAVIISIYILRRHRKADPSKKYVRYLLISHYILFIVLCFLIFFFDTSYHLQKGFFIKPICSLSDNDKIISLTFDDGPHPRYTPEILKILSKYNIQATFFFLGKNIRDYPAVVLKAIKDGHDIGSHSFTHRSMRWMWFTEIINEVEMTEKEMEHLGLERPALFRPPYGAKSIILERYLQQHGYRIVNWSLSPKDWKDVGHNILINRLFMFVESGSIIVLHDGPNAIGILPAFIEEMQKKGYRFMKISDAITIHPNMGNIK